MRSLVLVLVVNFLNRKLWTRFSKNSDFSRGAANNFIYIVPISLVFLGYDYYGKMHVLDQLLKNFENFSRSYGQMFGHDFAQIWGSFDFIHKISLIYGMNMKVVQIMQIPDRNECSKSQVNPIISQHFICRTVIRSNFAQSAQILGLI